MTDAAVERETQPNRPEMEYPSGLPPEELDRITEELIAALKTVFDPEIPVDIYELGQIGRAHV